MKRLYFPAFNALVGAAFGGVVGYYVFAPIQGILYGMAIGLIPALLLEFLLGKSGIDSWIYRRRVLFLVLLEIPLVTFVIGPYAYVVANSRPDHYEICCETPLDYGADTYESLKIRTPEGFTLSGWFIPPVENPGAVIVLLHGGGRDRRGCSWYAKQLITAGYGIMMYDQRGLGESSGEIAPMGYVQAGDLLAVLDFLQDRPEVDPERIGAVGISTGAHISINAAYRDQRRIKAMWLDGIQAQRVEDFPAAETTGEEFALLINKMILAMSELYYHQPVPAAFSDILPELRNAAIMMVAGGDERFERLVNEQYRDTAGANIEVWIIEGALHVGGPFVIPEEYADRMLYFFETNLP
jgi:uncharacterized protein